MTKRPRILAAGGVIMRERKGRRQVLLIYRKSYKDWSLPKGKGTADEYFPETAVREILEETGVTSHLDLRLTTIRYKVSKGLKAVHYWRGTLVKQRRREPDAEVERSAWFDVDAAIERVSYDDEREVIREAAAKPATTALIIVRHAKAMLRKDWSGPDQKRRLTGRGRRQAQDLIRLFESFGVTHLKSSSARRCMDTLAPYAAAHGLDVEAIDLFTEEEGTAAPERVSARMAEIAAHLEGPTVVCGHRPVLPAMYAGLGLAARPMVVGEALVIHLDADGLIVRSEILKPTA